MEFASYYADINTYFKEASNQFISGVLDVEDDAEWNKYIETLEGMNVERCVELKQAALDRYLAR